MNNQLNELFALPINVKTIEISGKQLHTSDTLKEKFIQSIKESDKFNLLKNIEKLVNDERVVPVFSSKSVMSFFIRKFPWTSSGDITKVFAFYNSETDKVVIMLDNTSNFFGITPNSDMAKLLIHELMHVFIAKNVKAYLKLFGPELNKYYSYTFERIFGSTLSSREVDVMISTLATNYELKDVYFKKLFAFMYKSLKNKTKFKDSELRTIISAYCYTLYLFMSGSPKVYEKRYFIFENYFSLTYKKVFGVDIGEKACFQELIITSEVIASISDQQFIANKVERAINSIK